MSESETIPPLMRAAAEMLRLPLEAEFEAGVRANLEVAQRMAALIEGFELDDEAEPAPVYRP